ncbi:hypothetical protein KIH39_10535 [Telmatocola sphagniphila]|uniref:DUF1559 domain-containing protein n=1 Tax=Telmatocola sphagniphila TaxID=1123043 RepID=A0A8E6B9F3_9BACT|nr:hypothetical protein [Telmatocola sphagniphila]QVL34317.1 hypothetical protein KIH39_10535 [Telmatocola sphagniphila]
MFARLLVLIAVVGLGVFGLGLILTFLGYARNVGDRKYSENNIRQIGFAMMHCTDPGSVIKPESIDYFPSGTLPNPALKRDERLSLYAYFVHSLDRTTENANFDEKTGMTKLWSQIDKDQKWNLGSNRELATQKAKHLIVPATKKPVTAEGFAITNYVANGGLENGAALPKWNSEQLRGLFEPDIKTPYVEVKDGLAQTIAFLETDFFTGPWLQGGPSTLRTWKRDQSVYLGPSSDLGGIHLDGVYAAMADGRAHFLTWKTDPRIFRSLLTIDSTEEPE